MECQTVAQKSCFIFILMILIQLLVMRSISAVVCIIFFPMDFSLMNNDLNVSVFPNRYWTEITYGINMDIYYSINILNAAGTLVIIIYFQSGMHSCI